MKKTLLALTVALFSLSGAAFGAEFQPMGALGIGGAGVARTTNAMAGYWNPAGLAFNERGFSMPIDVSVGLRVSKGLADNVDKVSKFTERDPNTGQSVIDSLEHISSNPNALGDVISLLSVLKDIQTQKGVLSLQGNAVLALQVQHFSFGAFGTMEGFARPDIDTTNVLPGDTGSAPATRSDIVGATAGTTLQTPFFTDPTIKGNLTSALTGAGFTNDQARDLLNSIENRLGATSSGTAGVNLPSVTQSQAADTIINTLIPAIVAADNPDPTNPATIQNNRTAVVLKSLAYVEFPISYGHPIDLGRYGKLGIGASIKPIKGRVYSSELLLVKDDSSVGSGTISENLTKNFEESVNVTFDLGLFYKYGEWLNVGLVGKNLTSPKFDSPQLKDQHGRLVTTDAQGRPIDPAEKVTLKPQVRAGIALDPFSWLTIAADIDVTNNETVLSSSDYRSRNLGGGLELHPFTWFKLRGGMYKNLSNDDVGPVATAGLTFGTKWVNLDIDGAYGLEKAKYEEKDYPKEARVQGNLNIQF